MLLEGTDNQRCPGNRGSGSENTHIGYFGRETMYFDVWVVSTTVNKRLYFNNVISFTWLYGGIMVITNLDV